MTDKIGLPGSEWTRFLGPPAMEGLVEEVTKIAQRIASYAVFAAVGGKIVLTVGEVGSALRAQSVRKSLMNGLIGHMVDEGMLTLSDTLKDFDIDDIDPPLSPAEKEATIRDLVMARSGVYHFAASESLAQARLAPERHSHRPGEHWWYKNWDFNVLGTIVERASGLKTFDAFQEWFAVPLQMQDFDPGRCIYKLEPVSVHPSYQFAISARDLARFGLFYLREGDWNGRRLLSANWIRDSIAP